MTQNGNFHLTEFVNQIQNLHGIKTV